MYGIYCPGGSFDLHHRWATIGSCTVDCGYYSVYVVQTTGGAFDLYCNHTLQKKLNFLHQEMYIKRT